MRKKNLFLFIFLTGILSSIPQIADSAEIHNLEKQTIPDHLELYRDENLTEENRYYIDQQPFLISGFWQSLGRLGKLSLSRDYSLRLPTLQELSDLFVVIKGTTKFVMRVQPDIGYDAVEKAMDQFNDSSGGIGSMPLLNYSIEHNPNYFRGYALRCRAYTLIGDYSKAIADCEKALSLNPNSAGTWNYKGALFYAQEKGDQAHYSFSKAVELSPNETTIRLNRAINNLRVRNQRNLAIQDLNFILEQEKESISALFYRGLAFKSLKEYEKAIKDFEEVLAINPQYELVIHERNESYSALGQAPPSLPKYSRKELESIDSYNAAALDAIANKKYSDAIDFYSNIINIQSDDSEAYYNRALARTNLAPRLDFDSALKSLRIAINDLNKSIQLNPQNFKAYSLRSFIYSHHLREYDNALDDVNKSLDLASNPEEKSEAYNTRGAIYLQKEDYRKAKQDFEMSITHSPDISDAYNNLGLIYQKEKQHEKALENYQKCLDLDPNSLEAIVNISNTLVDKKEYQKADVWLVEHIDNFQEDKYELAYLYLVRGKLYARDFKNKRQAIAYLIESAQISQDMGFNFLFEDAWSTIQLIESGYID